MQHTIAVGGLHTVVTKNGLHCGLISIQTASSSEGTRSIISYFLVNGTSQVNANSTPIS